MKHVNALEHASEIMQELKRGVLLTTQANGRTNTMTISWGQLGIEWSKPIFTTYLRQGRFTKELLDANPEFTVNIPMGAYNRKILAICGTRSGRDTDKFELMGLTKVPSEIVSVPGIKELPLTLECRVVYRQLQDATAITEANMREFYPQDVDGSYHGANRDLHTMYYGEIVNAYIAE